MKILLIFCIFASLGIAKSEEKENDVCELPIDPGPCKGYEEGWTYSKKFGCEKFIYGGCGGNKNRFQYLEDCQNTCGRAVCMQENSQAGTCSETIDRFTYSQAEGCIKFKYSGCGGNKNNFETLDACERACGGPLCDQPIAGGCNGYNRRWTYSKQLGCIRFIYGGCNGNQNNFLDQGECENACGAAICKQPPKAGNGKCRDYVKRWYYIADDKCKEYDYSGCGGNGNRFLTEKECVSACGSGPICEQPAADGGSCKGLETRITYTKEKGCHAFSYSGCGGNQNNFNSVTECVKFCERNI